MTHSSILITGGYGCIGAEAAKWLMKHTEANVVIVSRRANEQRSAKQFGECDRSRLNFIEASVCEQDIMRRVLSEYRITHVLHLAGLQTPDCNDHRDLGLQATPSTRHRWSN